MTKNSCFKWISIYHNLHKKKRFVNLLSLNETLFKYAFLLVVYDKYNKDQNKEQKFAIITNVAIVVI